jgi:hypothetical protein
MQIVFSSSAGLSRQRALAYLRELKAANSEFRVVDIGGAANPWSAEVADAYVDLHPANHAPTIIGDIHDPLIWEKIRAARFNFCICSHILEDIRDPLFVLRQISHTFEHGYIAAPNKHVEFGHIESRHYVGYAHHRWIFTLRETSLGVIAKWPFASFFSPRKRTMASFRASSFGRAWRRLAGRRDGLSAIGPLPWWRADLAGPENELAFIWKGQLAFEEINGDYAGASPFELALLYRDALVEGL